MPGQQSVQEQKEVPTEGWTCGTRSEGKRGGGRVGDLRACIPFRIRKERDMMGGKNTGRIGKRKKRLCEVRPGSAAFPFVPQIFKVYSLLSFSASALLRCS